MEIVTRPRVEGWYWALFGPIFLFSVAGSLLLEGLEGAVFLALLAAVMTSGAVLSERRLTYCRATVDESGVTLRPAWQGRLAAKPFAFRWENVRNVGRWPRFARNPAAGLVIRFDRTQPFWTLRPQPRNKVVIPPAIAASAPFVQAVQQYVPPDRIALGALDFRVAPFSMRRRVIGSLILLACVAWASWGVAQVIQGGSLIGAMISFLTGCLAAIALILCTPWSAVVSLISGTWFVALVFMKFIMAFSALAGTSSLTAGYLSANVGALVAAMVLVLIGTRPRWRHAALFYALVALGFAAGWCSYSGIPGTRVAAGHLPSFGQTWTPNGDGFLISTATLFLGDSAGPLDMQWYDEDLRPGNRLTLPKEPEVQAVGQEGAVAVTRSKEAAELWFLPRRSGPARKLTASDDLARFRRSPSKHYVVFCREGHNEETWERCDVETGQLLHFDMPPTMKGAWAQWGKDDSTVLWMAGSPPCESNGTPLKWSAPLPQNGVIAKPGELYRFWVWKSGAAPQGHQATTQWLACRYAAREERLFVCRVAEDQPLRKEFVAFDFSGPETILAPATEAEFAGSYRPSAAPTRHYEFVNADMMRGRAYVEDTVTGTRRFLKHGIPPMASAADLQWSPRGNKFLMDVLEWRLPADFWCWRRNPVDNLMNGSTVCLVVVE